MQFSGIYQSPCDLRLRTECSVTVRAIIVGCWPIFYHLLLSHFTINFDKKPKIMKDPDQSCNYI